MFALFALILLALHAEAVGLDDEAVQMECADGAANPTDTPCIVGECPTGRKCIKSPRGEFCCDPTKVTPVPVCQDEHVDYCNKYKDKCETPGYKNTMQDKCQLTCGLCLDCHDSVDPRTNSSNCAQNLALCNNEDYKELMKEKCRKTCRNCV